MKDQTLDPAAMTANLIIQLESLATHLDDVARLMLTSPWHFAVPSQNARLHLHAVELRGAADLVRDWVTNLTHPETDDD